MSPPCVVFEDDSLLVVNKPAGLNTHRPAPYAGEGLYDWLRHREPRWSSLAIVHRLDKHTSGLLVFTKTPAANKSLTLQFTERTVRKRYVLWTDRAVPPTRLVRSMLVRCGEKYVSRPVQSEAAAAETEFTDLGPAGAAPGVRDLRLVLAQPRTGRTHQIRVHAADAGFPILGDDLYGGTPAARVCLHASEITFSHPVSGTEVTFATTHDFATEPAEQLRAGLIDAAETNAYRLVHGLPDGFPGWYVDKLGGVLLSQSDQPIASEQKARLQEWSARIRASSAAHKVLTRTVRQVTPGHAAPQVLIGSTPPPRFEVLENGIRYLLSLEEGYSVGLFLDQRDNRRRLLTRHVAADFSLPRPRPPSAPTLLNTFAYTCAFSVCAAKAGYHTTSLDLSKKYLDWGRANFRLNGLDDGRHEFVYGDVFDWLRRWGKRGRRFDLVILDPPTFSQSKTSGAFRAEAGYPRLLAGALQVLAPGGVILASSNAERWPPQAFVATLFSAVGTAGRQILKWHYAPQPPDFPIAPGQPGYLKTAWLQGN